MGVSLTFDGVDSLPDYRNPSETVDFVDPMAYLGTYGCLNRPFSAADS